MYGIACFGMPGICECTVVDGVYPTQQPCFFRFPIKKVEIVLAHKEFTRVEWIHRVTAVRDSCEGRISMLAQLAEAALRGTEGIVGSRRRDGVEAGRLDIVETVVAVCVCDRQTILGAGQTNSCARNWPPIFVQNAAADCSVRRRRHSHRAKRLDTGKEDRLAIGERVTSIMCLTRRIRPSKNSPGNPGCVHIQGIAWQGHWSVAIGSYNNSARRTWRNVKNVVAIESV